MQLKEIKSLIEGIIRTGEQVLDTGHHKKIIKVDCVRVHLQVRDQIFDRMHHYG